jgi:hypothetical protein
MKIFGRIFLLFLLQVLVIGSASADEMISVKAGYQVLKPEGVFAGIKNGAGSDIDFNGPLDFDSSKEPTVEAALQLGNFRLSAAYLPLDLSGRGSLTSDITFGGQTFTIGENLESDVDASFFDFGLTYYLLNIDDLPVRVQFGPELAAKVVTGDLKVRSVSTGIEEEVSGTAGLPTVGGRLRLGLADFLGVVARVGYAQLGDNSFLDLDGQVEFSPLPLVGIYAGYRYLDLDIDQSGVVLDSQFSGPYGGLMVRF